MRAASNHSSNGWLEEIESAIIEAARERARDTMNRMIEAALMPGAPISGGELSRAVLDDAALAAADS